MGTIRCSHCGQVLAKGASFCRACGARYAAPAPAPQVTEPQPAAHSVPRPQRAHCGTGARSWWPSPILAIGSGAAVALLLATGGSTSSSTVVQRTTVPGAAEAADATDSIGAGRYVQAGSFQTTAHAEAERRRLAGHGIDVGVVSSNGAQELYPGFQVLLGGPLHSAAEEATMLRSLHRNGVPSAFARELTPAVETGGPEAIAGRWTGEVERTSSEHPNLNGVLPTTLTVAPNGTVGSLDFSTMGCHATLSLVSAASHTLSYDQEPPCAGSGTLQVRLAGGELMLTLLSPATDSFALGTLGRLMLCGSLQGRGLAAPAAEAVALVEPHATVLTEDGAPCDGPGGDRRERRRGGLRRRRSGLWRRRWSGLRRRRWWGRCGAAATREERFHLIQGPSPGGEVPTDGDPHRREEAEEEPGLDAAALFRPAAAKRARVTGRDRIDQPEEDEGRSHAAEGEYHQTVGDVAEAPVACLERHDRQRRGDRDRQQRADVVERVPGVGGGEAEVEPAEEHAHQQGERRARGDFLPLTESLHFQIHLQASP